ncbi:MAG: hypothetical protein NWE98_02900 [Candidatus Bathyarchaeota archaeon]|nr:hypothetical protein [Candidatus Bathyarchaeota archaeon]
MKKFRLTQSQRCAIGRALSIHPTSSKQVHGSTNKLGKRVIKLLLVTLICFSLSLGSLSEHRIQSATPDENYSNDVAHELLPQNGNALTIASNGGGSDFITTYQSETPAADKSINATCV